MIRTPVSICSVLLITLFQPRNLTAQELDCGLPNGALETPIASSVPTMLPLPEDFPLPPPETGDGPEIGPVNPDQLVPRNMKPQVNSALPL